jgi:hypothetical protein
MAIYLMDVYKVGTQMVATTRSDVDGKRVDGQEQPRKRG